MPNTLLGLLRTLQRQSKHAGHAGHGNPDALRGWYDSAKSGINWGSGGDFGRCVDIASKHMTDEQAKGFCNERHQDATGHPPGHAPGEQPPASKHAAPGGRPDALGSESSVPGPGTTPGATWFSPGTSQISSQAELSGAIYDSLGHSYPAHTLGWVRGASWSYDPAVPLGQIDAQDRPSGPTDGSKVAAIAGKLQRGERMHPVVLVKKTDNRYAVADGYHRIGAHHLVGKPTANAYVASIPEDYGPWTFDMHAAKMGGTVQFREYSREQRQKLVKMGWALPDDESGGAFPISDREDVINALRLVGHTNHPRATVIAHIRKRARDLHADDLIGEVALASTSKHARSGAGSGGSRELVGPPMEFARERRVTPDGKVVRRGKVYQAGTRRDMHGVEFDVTRGDLGQMVLNFPGRLPVGSGHPEAPSHLDGHLGDVVNLYLGDNPDELWADAELPAFVDDVLTQELGDEPAPVSMIFDYWTKAPVGLDFVKDPNVVDAALTAAFARHDTNRGQYAMQRLHDTAVQFGAVCAPGERSMHASRHEADAVQQMHDTAVEHGAQCEMRLEEAPAPASMLSQTGATDTRDPFLTHTQTAPAHGGSDPDASDDNDALRLATAPASGNRDGRPISGFSARAPRRGFWNLFLRRAVEEVKNDPELAQFAALPEDEGEASATLEGVSAEQATDSGHTGRVQMGDTDSLDVQLREERALRVKMQADLERMRTAQVLREATQWAEAEILEHRSLPAEQEGLIDLYTIMALDDIAMSGTVKFSRGGREIETGRVQRLKEVYAARPEHWVTREGFLNSLTPEVLMAATRTKREGETGPLDDATKDSLLEMTPLGQKLKAERAKAAAR